jgi:hypothetical protein
MRAKLKVTNITTYESSTVIGLTFNAVSKKEAYPTDGYDEDNTYSRWTPSAELKMQIANPDLLDKFVVGQEFYVDFTPAVK